MRACLLAALLLVPVCVWASTLVEQITGTGRLVRQGVGLPLAAGDVLRPGDQIEMDANGEALIRFSNGVKLIVRRGAQVALDELPTEARDSTVLQLLRGALRYANTKVRELSSRQTRIQTPSGHFGVRGTDFDLVHLDQAQGPLVPAGTYVFVRDGLVEADVGGRVTEVGALQTALPQAGGVSVIASSRPIGSDSQGPVIATPQTPPRPSGPGVANVPGGTTRPPAMPQRDPFAWMQQMQTYEQRLVRRGPLDRVLDTM